MAALGARSSDTTLARTLLCDVFIVPVSTFEETYSLISCSLDHGVIHSLPFRPPAPSPTAVYVVSRSMFTANANEIIPGLWLGSEEAGQAPLEELVAHRITRVLVPANTGCEVSIHTPHILYKQLYVADTSGYPILPLFDECFTWVDEVLGPQGTEPTAAVLVHCAAGKSRSAAFVIGYLMYRMRMSFIEAYSHVRKCRPCVSTKFEEQLQEWERCGMCWNGDLPHQVAARQRYRRSPFNRIPNRES